MRRRKFITLLGGSAAWPLAARAQQPVPLIGLLSARSPAVDAPLISVIRRGFSDSGFIEGRNVTFDYRSADGQYDRFTGLAADLVRRHVAVIVTMGGDPSAPHTQPPQRAEWSSPWETGPWHANEGE